MFETFNILITVAGVAIGFMSLIYRQINTTIKNIDDKIDKSQAQTLSSVSLTISPLTKKIESLEADVKKTEEHIVELKLEISLLKAQQQLIVGK